MSGLLNCTPPATSVQKEDVTITYSDQMLQECVIRYTNYIKNIGFLFSLDPTAYYSNFLKSMGSPIDAKEYFNTYSNYLRSLNGFFMPNPSSVYTV